MTYLLIRHRVAEFAAWKVAYDAHASAQCEHERETDKNILYLIALLHVCVATPNDLKLSDGGAWRGSCEGGAQRTATDVGQSDDRTRRVRARIAATVTRRAVRCSAGTVRLILRVGSAPPIVRACSTRVACRLRGKATFGVRRCGHS